jgi:predicted metal-binding protein
LDAELSGYLSGSVTMKDIQSRPTLWRTVLLVCGKCTRKMDGGYGPKGKDTLESALRSGLAHRGQRRQVRVIETRCMGICPKKAVTAMNANRPGTILTVPRKTDAEVILANLLDGVREGPLP